MIETEKYAYGFDLCRNEEEVKARLRSLAKMLHPDAGGDATLFGNCKAEADRRMKEIRDGGRTRNSGRKSDNRARDAAEETLSGLMESPLIQGILADTIRRCVPPRYRGTVAGIAAMLSDSKEGR